LIDDPGYGGYIRLLYGDYFGWASAEAAQVIAGRNVVKSNA
jgi:hypothetical protein